MVTVNDIVEYMQSVVPQEKKEGWDNVGLLCGRRSKEVHTVLVALDPFMDVVQEAAAVGAELIVTHHPLIFHPLYSVTEETAVGRTVESLVRGDISAFCAHTNLDIAPQGVGQCLAEALGLSDIRAIDPIETDAQGRQWGLLRMGTVPEQGLAVFLAHIKQSLDVPCLRYAAARETVHRVAVGGGACAGEWKQALGAGCDCFVTADAKYNDFWDARNAGLTLIDAGHFYTENPVCKYLQRLLQGAFPEVTVLLSKTHADCMKFYGFAENTGISC